MIMYSVIVPWHRNDELLQKALKSVPDRPDVELLPVEDKERRGAGYARNQALAKAQGRWLLFLDSDDYFTPDAFDILDRHADDDAEVVYFKRRAVMLETGEPSRRTADKNNMLEAYSSRPAELEFFCRYCCPEPTDKMVRRELGEREGIRFDETLCANDYMFSLLCGRYARKVAYDPSSYYVVTESEGSISMNYFDQPRKQLDRMDVYWRVQQLLASWGLHLYPFSGIWMMARKAGPQAREVAEEFRRKNRISRLKIWCGCFNRVLRKRLHIGVPFNA